MIELENRKTTFEVPVKSTEADYNLAKGRYECPNCGEDEAVRHSGKKIGDCNNCNVNLRFNDYTATFITVVDQ